MTPVETLPAWMALAYRSALSSAEQQRIAWGEGPDPATFPPDVIEREALDLSALKELGVRLLTLRDEEYPAKLRGEGAPLLLQIAGRASLLADEGVETLTRYRGAAGARLMEVLESGSRARLVLGKGMLKAASLLRALREPLEDGSLVLVTAEPPRASWGPTRDRRRDAIAAALRR